MPELTGTVGRYVIGRPLGQGAMGVVYLAADPLLKRRVAIKVVRATGPERDHALARFRREAEISAQLNHPNIVTIYDVGEAPGVGPFLAMEYVEGHGLGRLIREGALDVEARFSILVQAMRALRAAHRRAIVHRDVKPDNILVAEDGRVKLMDFGIAETMAPRRAPSGEFLGSPAYSAPELLRGSEPTPNSDRYAFAVTAFELLTGRLPHPGTTVASVISHVLTEPPVIPQGMSGDMAKAFRQALAQDPDDRPETLVDFLAGLVAACPMEPLVRIRINQLFRQDDYAGDIVPLRRIRPADRPNPDPLPGVRSSGRSSQEVPAGESGAAGRGTAGPGTAGRETAGRSTGAPALPTPSFNLPPSVKIELEDSAPTPPRPIRTPPSERRSRFAWFTPMWLLKWSLLLLAGWQLVLWIQRLAH